MVAISADDVIERGEVVLQYTARKSLESYCRMIKESW
jgi:hypothetical protein